MENVAFVWVQPDGELRGIQATQTSRDGSFPLHRGRRIPESLSPRETVAALKSNGLDDYAEVTTDENLVYMIELGPRDPGEQLLAESIPSSSGMKSKISLEVAKSPLCYSLLEERPVILGSRFVQDTRSLAGVFAQARFRCHNLPLLRERHYHRVPWRSETQSNIDSHSRMRDAATYAVTIAFQETITELLIEQD
ncbi:hypothetical protein SELMODRAFT_432498 [Selaginella moellendorffii]|uniref:Uncharacterized protein n=1 Tax=Selaginella moellendorffii TaxID=88036 RepID=D8TG66_SELML|nr:hypothetical protein SELMODRAFT_432498 [Selaginella moellendorffii]